MMTLKADKPGDGASLGERQVVALQLGAEVYGIDIAHIHTVITPQPITAVPKAPAYVEGVINLRGRVVPVIDLRTRFGLPPLGEHTRSRRIVIVEVKGLTAGLVVDAVSEVLRLPADSIDPPSQLVASAETDCIIGIGRIPSGRRRCEMKTAGVDWHDVNDERLIILLDVHKALTAGPEEADSLRRLQPVA